MELVDELVDCMEQGRALSCVGRRELGGDECQADGRVGHEEMFVDNRICATGAAFHHGLQHATKHVAHADGVGLNQFWHRLTYAARQVGMVLLHLTGHVADREQGIERCVGTGVNEDWQMVGEIGCGIEKHVIAQTVEDIGNGARVAPQQRVDEGIARLGKQHRGCILVA